MSRKIVLDTETTGMDIEQGHRIIEIGCVEIADRRISEDGGFHRYINPEREIDAGAKAVHGLDEEFLRQHPPFADIAGEFLRYVDGAELLIHNAAFDVGFLNAELARLGGSPRRIEDVCTVTDTLALARTLYPGQRVSLDALCRRLDIDNSARTLHGARLDAHLLAEVYLAMTAGQISLELALDAARQVEAAAPRAVVAVRHVLRADADERAAHAAWLDRLDHDCGGGSVWRRDSA